MCIYRVETELQEREDEVSPDTGRAELQCKNERLEQSLQEGKQELAETKTSRHDDTDQLWHHQPAPA